MSPRTENSRSLTVLAAVLVMAASATAGILLRDRVDAGAPGPAAASLTDRTLVASRGQVEIPETDYFREMSRLLEKEYVEPVTDREKLAAGAVRGMVASLNDPRSLYYDKEEFATYLNAREGKLEGAGVMLALVEVGAANTRAQSTDGQPPESAEEVLVTRARIPRLMVVGISPDGSAAKAGVRVGDFVYEVDGHWVANTDLMVRFQQAQKDFDAKKITLPELNKLRREIRAKTQRALLPLKAMDRITQGSEGTVKVTWERSGEKRPTELTKTQTTLPALGVKDGVLTLRFAAGAEAALKSALAEGATRVDLRNSGDGDFDTMRACLDLVAPKGVYGVIATDRPDKAEPLGAKGPGSPAKLTLVVDESTRGAAAIFAQALADAGRATLEGKPSGDLAVRRVVALPEGEGFTLVTGEYRAKATTLAQGVTR